MAAPQPLAAWQAATGAYPQPHVRLRRAWSQLFAKSRELRSTDTHHAEEQLYGGDIFVRITTQTMGPKTGRLMTVAQLGLPVPQDMALESGRINWTMPTQ